MNVKNYNKQVSLKPFFKTLHPNIYTLQLLFLHYFNLLLYGEHM